MRTGRPRKPTAQKQLEGTYRADRAAHHEPQPRVMIPPCPAWLQGEGRKEYRRVAKLLVELRVLTEADRTALAAYAQQYQRWIDAENLIRKSGMLIKSPSGYLMQNPCLPIANAALKNMRALMAEFGLTPASRTRISAQVEEQEKSLAEMLFEAVNSE